MECKIKDNKGFGFIETIVVILLVSIVMVLSLTIKKTTFKKAALKEGAVLIEKIDAQVRLFRAQNGTFPSTAKVGNLSLINVNAVKNKYFKEFSIAYTSGDIFTINVFGSNIVDGVTMQAVIDANKSNKENLYGGEIKTYGL